MKQSIQSMISMLAMALAGASCAGSPGDDSSGSSQSADSQKRLLSCSAQYTFVSHGASFEFAPEAGGDHPEIKVDKQQEDSGGGIDAFRTMQGETAFFKYSVDLHLDPGEVPDNRLELTVESKTKGIKVQALAFPELLSVHGSLVSLEGSTDDPLGQTTDGSGAMAPIIRARLLCSIGEIPQNGNMEVSYPTLQPVPLH